MLIKFSTEYSNIFNTLPLPISPPFYNCVLAKIFRAKFCTGSAFFSEFSAKFVFINHNL